MSCLSLISVAVISLKFSGFHGPFELHGMDELDGAEFANSMESFDSNTTSTVGSPSGRRKVTRYFVLGRGAPAPPELPCPKKGLEGI